MIQGLLGRKLGMTQIFDETGVVHPVTVVEAGPCVVTQISGLIARRIVSWVRPGAGLVQGERLGMIAFGSQVTLRLPATSTLVVAAGDRVRAGLTPIAHLPKGDVPAPHPASE